MVQARVAGPDDLDRLLQLAASARHELSAERGGGMWAVREAPPEPRRAELQRAIHDRSAIVQVGCLDGYVAGYGIARLEQLRSGDRLAVVSDIFVEPAFREVSIGEVVMDALIGWARDHGCVGMDSLVLPGMRASKNFFERYGMKARALLVHLELHPTDPDHPGDLDEGRPDAGEVTDS